MSAAAFSLVQSLLCKDASKRLGSGEHGLSRIQAHPFFAGIDWRKVYAKEYVPAFVPCEESQAQYRYFQVQCSEPIGCSDNEGNNLLNENDLDCIDSDCKTVVAVDGFSFF